MSDKPTISSSSDDASGTFSSAPDTARPDSATCDPTSSDLTSPAFSIECPSCHTPFRADPESDLANLSCPSCGSRFSIIGDGAEASTYAHSHVRQTIAHFDLLEELGSGGFGRVWLARDTRLERVVAVKIPHARRMQGDKAEWFFREARAAAQLQHPNIVSVFEIGRFEDQIYIVSELIHGVTLGQWLSGRSPTAKDVATMCVAIAEGLDHAHGAGIVHRDLKPSNILVDREGVPRISDFGLAKRDQGEATLTVDGKILGTPSYMSPEQALGKAHHVTGKADIFSLGVIMFELLTLVRPFRGSTSSVIHQVINHDPPPLRSFNRNIPLDLEAICLKCLEKKPDHRYESAPALVNDLRRFLAGQPVSARRVTWANRLWRWCKRNPVVSVLAGLLIAVLVTGLISTTWLWKDAVSSADVALAAAQDADQSRARMRRSLYSAHMEFIRQSYWRGDVQHMEQTLSQYIPGSPDETDLRCFIWYHLWGNCQRFSHMLDHGSHVVSLAFSPDGERLVSAGRDDRIRLWDLGSEAPITDFSGDKIVRDCHLAYSANGRWIAVAAENNVVRVLDAERGDVEAEWSVGAIALAFSPDSQTLACVNEDGTVRMVDTDTWQPRGRPIGKRMAPAAVALSRDLSVMVIANRRGWIFVVDLESEDVQTIPSERLETVWAIAISPDRKQIAASYLANVSQIRLMDASSGKTTHTLVGHVGPIGSIVYSPLGDQLASACNDGKVKLWDANRGELTATFHEHVWRLTNGFVRYSNDGRQLASASADGTVKVWELLDHEPMAELRGHVGRVESVSFTPDSRTLISGGSDGTIRLWDVETDRTRRVIDGHTSAVFDVTCSSDGATIGSAGNDGMVRLWNTETGDATGTLEGHASGVTSVDFSDDGSLIASGSVDRTARIWNARTGAELRVLGGHGAGVRSVLFLGDDNRLATASLDSVIRIWDTSEGKELLLLKGHRGGVRCLALSSDGRILASGSEDRTVRLWDARTGDLIRVLDGHGGTVNTVAFCSDGKTLASSGIDREVRLWDFEIGETKTRLVRDALAKQVLSVVFSPDGLILASGSLDTKDKTIHVWRASDGFRIASPGRTSLAELGSGQPIASAVPVDD